MIRANAAISTIAYNLQQSDSKFLERRSARFIQLVSNETTPGHDEAANEHAEKQKLVEIVKGSVNIQASSWKSAPRQDGLTTTS